MYSNSVLRRKLKIFLPVMCLCIFSALLFGSCKNRDNKSGNKAVNTEKAVSTEKPVSNEKPANTERPENDEEKLLLNTDVLNESSASEENNNYEITKVRRGDFKYEMFAIGNIEYRDLYYAAMETEEAEIVEYKVEKGDKVNKGDVILEYKPVYDEGEYKQRVSYIEQQEKEYAAGYDTRRAEIIKAEHDIKNIKDKTEKEIKQLEIKKLKLALKKYQENAQNLDEQKKSLAEYREGLKKTKVVAPHSGYIMEIAEMENENIIRKGNVVAVISPKKDYYIKVNDTTHGLLRYNSDVTISVESGGGNIRMPGKVVMSSNILSYENTTENAYVEIVDEPEGVDWKGAIKVYFDSKEVKDVLLLDAKAVLFENKNEGSKAVSVPYVYIYKDNKTFKRYIQIFGSNNKEYLVLSGLTEGQEVAIYK